MSESDLTQVLKTTWERVVIFLKWLDEKTHFPNPALTTQKQFELCRQAEEDGLTFDEFALYMRGHGFNRQHVVQLLAYYRQETLNANPVEIPQLVPPALPESPSVESAPIYQYHESGDVISEIADTDLHLMIATKSGAGKSTTAKAVIHRIQQNRPNSQWFVIDPKTTDWLGLQKFGVVDYLMGDDEDQLIKALRAIERVYRILQDRKSADQKALMSGAKRQSYHDVYLLIDEWFTLLDKAQRFKATVDAGEDRVKLVKGHFADEYLRLLNEIIAQGRELKVHLILITQSHLCTEAGFSTAMRKSFAVVAQGRMGAKKDVGYDPIVTAINDQYLIPDGRKRKELQDQFDQMVALAQQQGDRPLLLTTMGIPRLALLPNLAHIHSVKIEGYRYPVIKAQFSSSSPSVESFSQTPQKKSEFDGLLTRDNWVRCQSMSLRQIATDILQLKSSAGGNFDKTKRFKDALESEAQKQGW